MASRPTGRSVKIADNERTGWSSDRPRPDGGRPRPANLAVHCSVLAPTDRLRYSPGSLLIVACASGEQLDGFLARVIEDPSTVLGLRKVKTLLSGRVEEQELQARAAELLAAALAKRLENRQTVVLSMESFDPAAREPFLRLAAAQRRPRHLIFLETARENISEEDLPALNELRRTLDNGELGGEGIQTALRLGGGSSSEIKRILFRPPPREED